MDKLYLFAFWHYSICSFEMQYAGKIILHHVAGLSVTIKNKNIIVPYIWSFSGQNRLVRRASDFILRQKLSGRASIDYKRLAMSVSPETLRSFVISVVDNITVSDGRVSAIVFRNGLAHNFVFKQ